MNKKGFTLIELLAVIIILGILMIIAIPSVTKYISDSRKNAYIDTAKEIIGSAKNLVNSGSLEMYDTDATYYIDVNCITTENAMKSPYGDFVKNGAFVVVTYDGTGYKYYWTSVDDAGQGIKGIIKDDKLDTDNIESDLTINDINIKRTLDGRGKVIIIDENHSCKKAGFDDQGLINISGETGERIVCIKATTLHTKTCERASEGCGATFGKGNTITYGTLVNGNPKPGDAYDCDVNSDGTYDQATERFYYVKSDGSNSILIYYSNMNDQAMYAYDSSGQNWHGPRTGYQYLPSKTEWSNPGLIELESRQILTQNGLTSTSGGEIEKFTYTGKASRLLTSQEINIACEITIGNNTTGELDGCTWLMENVGYYEKDNGTRSLGYWLETPYSNDTIDIWRVTGNDRYVYNSNASYSTYFGIRPVITVLTSNIEK